MVTEQPSSPIVPRPDLLLAEWVRKRRRTLGLTQEQVVDGARAVGVTISRGHLGNLELGNYAIRAPHVLALDVVLEGHGELIALAEHVWGESIGALMPADWVDHGKQFDHLLLHEVLVPPTQDPGEDIVRWWKSHSDNDSIVVKGREQVEAALFALLTLAKGVTLPATRGPIEFAGPFEGLREIGKPGLPKNIRQSLRGLMESGWACIHHIPTPLDDPNETTLVYIAASLIACSKFEARIIDARASQNVENLLVIPDLAAVQFYATGSARRIDAAVIHRSADAQGLLQQRLLQIRRMSRQFVTRFERRPLEWPILTTDEFAFRKRLSEVTSIAGPSRWLVGCFPTATNPPDVYRSRVARRRIAALAYPGFDHKLWDNVVDFHLARHRAFKKQLKDGDRCQVIVDKKDLTLEADGRDWTRDERILLLKYVLALMNRYAHFEVGVADSPLADGVKTCAWEVRESATKGIVIVQSRFTPVRELGKVEEAGSLPVDLEIEAPGAVRAFAAYYDHLWDTAVNHNQEEIKKMIQKVLPSG